MSKESELAKLLVEALNQRDMYKEWFFKELETVDKLKRGLEERTKSNVEK